MKMISTDATYKYSEIFYSFQGEGKYTGMPTAWIRFFLCNLNCDGFGQADPTDRSSYILPYKDFDVSKIDRIEDMPVFDYGCDSSYTWAKKYRHLAHDSPANVIAERLSDTFTHETNPDGLYKHPVTGQETHLAFTGGEPMLNQPAMVNIMLAAHARGNVPRFVTMETNGSRKIRPELTEMINRFYMTSEYDGLVDDSRGGTEWFWSVSPKIFSTSGELPKKAIRPEFVADYKNASDAGQLKFVVNGTQQSWDEVEQHVKSFRENGVNWPVYIMPVGATKEQQEEDQIAEIAIEAMKRGYYFSGRLHCSVFGNKIGT